MSGVTIDPGLAGFSAEPQQAASQPTSGGGVVIDPSLTAPIQETAQQGQRPAAPSGFQMGAMDPVYAAGQLIAKGLEQLPEGMKLGNVPVAAAARAFNERVVPQREAEYQRGRMAAGEEGFDWSRTGGNVASGILPGAAISKGASLIAPASRLAQSAISGGVSSALTTPVESATDFWQNKIQQAGLGAGLGVGIDKTLGAVVSPAITAAGQKLKDLGVTLTPGQAFGGVVQTAEDLLAKLPFTGSTARSAQERAVQEFNTGVINRALSNVGEQLPKGTTGRDAINYLYKASDKAYEDVLPKVKLGGTMDLYQGIGNTLGSFSTTEPKFAKYLNEFVSKKILDPLSKGDIEGRAFKDIDIQLGQDITAYSRQGGDGTKLANALKDIQGYLRQGLRATNPNDAPALDAANKLFADRVRIEKAAGYLGADEGVFNPQQLLQATKAADSSSRNAAFARGQANMQDIAEAGTQALGRTGATKMSNVGGGAEATVAGATGIGSMAAGALPLTAALPLAPIGFYTSPMQNLFNAAMIGGRPAAAPAVRQMLPATLAPTATGGLLRDPEYAARFEFRGMANK